MLTCVSSACVAVNISSTKVESESLICVCSWLQVVKQCCGTDGVEANYIKTEILPPFFKHFWQHRMALDRRNYRQASGRDSLAVAAAAAVCARF